MSDSLLWHVRHFIYNHFADTTRAPSVEESARQFNITIEEAGQLYRELHNRHAFFLEPETLTIRMANPFSGIPTKFKIRSNSKTYYANCAWDMFGIPATLHADAVIEAVCTESNDSVRLEIKNGNIAQDVAAEDGGSNSLLVHFPLPFASWYDDLAFT